MSPKARFILWSVLAAGLLLGQLGWIASLRGERIMANDALLVGGWCVLAMLPLAMLLLLRSTPGDAIRLSRRWSAFIILAGAALLQAAAVVMLVPALSDDPVRYRVDGWIWLIGKSPYATAPRQVLNREDARWPYAADAVDHAVQYPDLPSRYPPVAEAIFVAGRSAETVLLWDNETPAPPIELNSDHPWRMGVSGLPLRWRALPFRFFFGLCAVAATGLLLAQLRRTGRSPWWAILLGWNPLVAIECGGMGHIDIAGVVLLLFMIRGVQSGRYRWAAICLALACGIKPIAILLLPWLWRDTHRRGDWRCGRRAIATFLVALSLIYVPAMLVQRGLSGWIAANRAYIRNWEANGSMYEVIKQSTHAEDGNRTFAAEKGKTAARLISLAAVALAAMLLWQCGATAAEAAYWLFITLLLFSPIVYPWHLLWALAFVPLLRSQTGFGAMVWSGTIAISCLLWRSADWTLSTRHALLEYVPVYAALAIELILLARATRPMPAMVAAAPVST